jgi:hypothetical protein
MALGVKGRTGAGSGERLRELGIASFPVPLMRLGSEGIFAGLERRAIKKGGPGSAHTVRSVKRTACIEEKLQTDCRRAFFG